MLNLSPCRPFFSLVVRMGVFLKINKWKLANCLQRDCLMYLLSYHRCSHKWQICCCSVFAPYYSPSRKEASLVSGFRVRQKQSHHMLEESKITLIVWLQLLKMLYFFLTHRLIFFLKKIYFNVIKWHPIWDLPSSVHRVAKHFISFLHHADFASSFQQSGVQLIRWCVWNEPVKWSHHTAKPLPNPAQPVSGDITERLNILRNAMAACHLQ